MQVTVFFKPLSEKKSRATLDYLGIPVIDRISKWEVFFHLRYSPSSLRRSMNKCLFEAHAKAIPEHLIR